MAAREGWVLVRGQPGDSSAVPFIAETVEVDTRLGTRVVLVLTPTRELVVREAPVGGGGKLSSVDRWIVEAGRQAALRDGAFVCIMRGRADEGEGVYRFSAGLDDAAAARIAKIMLRDQVVVYREMVRLGVCLFLHSEFGLVEITAFRTAVDELSDEFERSAKYEAKAKAEAEVDLWILRNLVFFLSSTLSSLTSSILPETLAMLEKRMLRVRRMALALSPEPEEGNTPRG